jgi:hypothetical protein
MSMLNEEVVLKKDKNLRIIIIAMGLTKKFICIEI